MWGMSKVSDLNRVELTRNIVYVGDFLNYAVCVEISSNCIWRELVERERGTVNEVTRTVKGTVVQLPKFKDHCKSIMSHFYKSSFSFALIRFT